LSHDTTILIVDDEPTGREVLAALLQTYRLGFARNGVEALEQAAASAPDLILLDVMMPDMDGYEVCRQIRATLSLAEIPIIMVTALDDRDSRLAGIEAGADDFISKPYDRAELRARVRTITRLNRYRRLVGQRVQFEWVVEQSDDGYVIVDTNGAIYYANAKARLYLDARSEGQLDGTFLDLAGTQYRLEPHIRWEDWIGLPAALRVAPRILVRPASDNADIFMVQVALLEMAPDPDQRYLVRLRDVTRAMIEQQSIWSFQSLIRHKLSTSMGQVIGGLRLIEGLELAPPQGMLTEMLSIVSHGATSLQADISDIFQYIDAPDLLRSERGRCAVAELPSIIADVNANLAITKLQMQESPAWEPNAGDLAISRHGLQLILGELIENAYKFHPRQDPAIEIAITREDNTLQLHIRDDGLALAPDQLARVWLPYYQGERYFTGQVPGMGLGLPMVASLLWRIGGSCRIGNRTPGPGVDVEICIPFAERI
jgi:DNA-binding response OmpR family regulator